MNKLPEDLLTRVHSKLAEVLQLDNTIEVATPLLVITGPNAAGKSLLRRIIRIQLKDDGIECMHLSQQGRATSGIQRAFLYGSEDYESTGVISCKTFKGAFNTSFKRDNPHVLLWDEPEIGMGEELQLGTGIWLRDKVREWPENLQGIILLTHSRLLVREVLKIPDSVFVNLGGMTAEEWLNREIEPAFPDDVREEGHGKFRKIKKVLDEIRSEKDDD